MPGLAAVPLPLPEPPLVRVAPWGKVPAPALKTAGSLHIHDTRLDRFIASRGIHPAILATASGYSRQHLLRIRKGVMQPSLRMIYCLVAGCIAITGDGAITVFNLFDLTPSRDAVLGAVKRISTGKRFIRRKPIIIT